MLQRVKTTRTNFKVSDFVSSLIKAWHGLYGTFPVKSQIAVIYSQWGVETGLGAYCWNNNVGNVKAIDIPGTVVEYCALNNVWEIVNGKKIVLTPDNPGSWFRSFPTLDDGVAYHIGFLRNTRYKKSWTAVEQGDTALFAHLLRQQGYYTAPEADYVRAMGYYFNKFMQDTTFDNCLQTIISEINEIDFPADYHTFDIKEDVFTKPERAALPSTTGVVSTLLNKLKSVFNR